MARLRSLSAKLAKAVIGLVALGLALLLITLALVETGWAKNLIRDLIVRQANQYLTATLSIGRLEGSLFRGLQLGDISLGRDGRTLIRIDEVSVSYSIRELVQGGTVIRKVRLTRPYVVGAKMADGKWDLGALVKRDSREQERSGPNRPIQIQSIEVIDGRISLQDPLDFGPAHVPTDFQQLNADFSFAYFPVRWTLKFGRVSWIGHAPDLSVNPVTGTFGRGPNGWFFDHFSVTSARSAYTLDGTVNTNVKPTMIDLQVRASRFAFQEWSGVIRGLRNIAVESSFETSLKGPVDRLATDLRLSGTGGGIKGQLTLDTSVPGWHGAGAVDVDRLNLARWLNRDDRPSDITGHVTFDLALELGRHFPRGLYQFDGPHAMYMDYAADGVRATGQITAEEVLIAEATATAYGAAVSTRESSIGIDAPFPYHFQGTTKAIDLRRVPKAVPIPHVESLLTFDYDVHGRFSQPFIAGQARFASSEFLGAAVGDGTVGSIDTEHRPVHYTGDGEIDAIDLNRFGEGLDVGWLRQPRYAGTMAGHFHVDGTGTTVATLALTGGGRLTRADMFKGRLTDADVTIAIADGTLRASYDGRLAGIDPSIPFADPRIEASLTGRGAVTATVRDLLTRTTALADYDVTGTLTLEPSRLRELRLDSGRVNATLRDSRLTIAELALHGPSLEGRGDGAIALDEASSSDFSYDVTRADLAQLEPMLATGASGAVTTSGRLTGPWTALRAAGRASVAQLNAYSVSALTLSGDYDVTVPSADAARANARVTGRAEFVEALGQSLQDVAGTLTYDASRAGFDVTIKQQNERHGRIAGSAALRLDRREASLLDLTVTLGTLPWRLATTAPPPTVSWNDEQVAITPVEFTAANEARVGMAGTWRTDGKGALHVTASHLFLDTLQAAFDRPTRYGGVVDLDATVHGTREHPEADGRVTVSSGRIERVSYEKLEAKFSYGAEMVVVDARLDQAPGVWVTAVGTVPLGLMRADAPEQPIDVTVKSSAISLGLIEGVTDVVRDVTGNITLDVKAVGTSKDPHVNGTVTVAGAGFLVVPTGSKYRNIRASLALALDRITVEALHIEDADGHPLDVRGSLGTHELRVGDLQIEGNARQFEVMRNELGTVKLDAAVKLEGRYESPRITGDLTLVSGSTVRVDEVLSRALFQPYATEAARITEVDAVAALNPWDRLGLDLTLHVPATLRLTGDSVQISQDTPIGLGDINLRVAGDLYLYKDPGQPLSVTGSFDQITGTYAFQGRGFNVLESSSINFRGDLNPEIYVTVTRVISGVETRVSIFGPLKQPELRLASTPPLDQSDILSLIVFNTSTNQLSAAQQQQLVARAGVLAAGFLAQPIVAAISNETGIDIFEIEPGDVGTDVKVTIGHEIAPGLVARFSRQFGQEAYDEATVEYYLSRLFRLRATFSDAQTLASRSFFRRVERAGIDLLLYFSF